MDSIFVKFLKYLASYSDEYTSDTDFSALVNQTLNNETFSVPKSETSTKMRTCPGNPYKPLYVKPYYFGTLNNFQMFFQILNSGPQIHEGSECCLDFYGDENVKYNLDAIFSQANKTLWFCCSNFLEKSCKSFLGIDQLYDKSNPVHNLYVGGNSYPFIDFLRKGIIEYSNGTYDTMIKEFVDNLDLLHTNSHKFIAFMYMYSKGVVMSASDIINPIESDNDLILMTTEYFNSIF